MLSEESELSEVSDLRRRVRGGGSGANAPRTSKKADSGWGGTEGGAKAPRNAKKADAGCGGAGKAALKHRATPKRLTLVGEEAERADAGMGEAVARGGAVWGLADGDVGGVAEVDEFGVGGDGG